MVNEIHRAETEAERQEAWFNGLTPAEAGQLFPKPVSATTVRKLIDGGELRAMNIGAGASPRYVTTKKWLREFFERRTSKADEGADAA